MRTVADLVAAGRERDGVAIDAPDRSAPYTCREFATNAWKAGNLLGHYTHPGGTVGVVAGPKPTDDTGGSGSDTDREGVVDAADPLLAVLGGTLVGATVALPPNPPVDAGALVRPAGVPWRDRYPAEPGCSVLAYGGPPEAAGVTHFEAALWSENPVEPPERVDNTTPAVRARAETYTHGALVDTARDIVDEHGLDASSRVGLTADLREPGALVAGVIAPLSVGATVVPGDRVQVSDDVTLLVTDDAEGETRRLAATSVTARLGERQADG